MMVSLLRRLQSDSGQALAEYSLILAFVALVCVVALTGIGLAVSGELSGFAAAFGGGGSSDVTPTS